MATITLLPITNWHGLLPTPPDTPVSPGDAGGDENGLNGFWVIEASVSGHWSPVGDTDLGACLQVNGDGKTIAAQHAGGDALAGGNSPVAFADTSVIPLDATIDSVQLVVGMIASHVDSADVCTVIAGVGGSDVGLPTLTGVSDLDFTGTGLYSTAVMTVTPGLGVAWERADLFANPLDYFSSPRGFMSLGTAATGGGGSPTTAAFSVDYMAMIVEYSGGAAPQNPNSTPPFQTPGQWALHRFDLTPRREAPRPGGST